MTPTEPWTTSIEFTVTPTDDPDVVKVPTPYGNYIHHRVADIDAPGVLADAARAYFDAHPNLPKKGQYISATRRNGTVCEGTVTRELDGGYRGVDLDGAWAGYLPHTNDTNRGEFPHDILSWTLAEPPKPAHPLADAKPGEWWLLEYEDDSTTAVKIREDSTPGTWAGVESARKIYVIPADEADKKVYYLRSVGAQGVAAQIAHILDLAL